MNLASRIMKRVVGRSFYRKVRGKLREMCKAYKIEKAILRVHGKRSADRAYLWNGDRLIVNPKDERARKLLLQKEAPYFARVPFLVSIASRSMNPDVFLDVGANYGECALSFRKTSNAQVVAMEANPGLIEFLEKNLRPDLDDNVKILQTLVSSQSNDRVPFYIDRRWSGVSAVNLTPHQRSGKTVMTVSTRTVDEIVAMHCASARNVLIKIDVEGHEPSVLAGAQEVLSNADSFAVILEYDERYIAERSKVRAIDFLNSINSFGRSWYVSKQETFEVLSPESISLNEVPAHTDIVVVGGKCVSIGLWRSLEGEDLRSVWARREGSSR